MAEVKWLADLFGAYDFYYLDPLVIKDAELPPQMQKKSSRGLFTLPFGKKKAPEPKAPVDHAATLELLKKIKKIIGVEESNQSLVPFFENSIQKNLLEDRGKQTKIAGAITGAFTKDKDKIDAERKFSGLDKLCDANWLRKTSNQTLADCFIVVEGAITRVAPAVQPDLYASVQVATREVDHYVREVHFALAEHPGSLLWLEDRSIGLMVDRKALSRTFNSVRDVVGLGGCYPYAQVIGYWQTDRTGRPFIDVIAILLKTLPTMERVLHERAGTDKKFLQMLWDGCAAVQRWQKETRVYQPENDWQLLEPYALAKLCCFLNGINAEYLAKREPPAARALSDYETELRKFAKLLAQRGISNRLLTFLENEYGSIP